MGTSPVPLLCQHKHTSSLTSPTPLMVGAHVALMAKLPLRRERQVNVHAPCFIKHASWAAHVSLGHGNPTDNSPNDGPSLARIVISFKQIVGGVNREVGDHFSTATFLICLQ